MMANNNLLLLIIFHLLAAFSIPSGARCLENHRHALLQLKGRFLYPNFHLSSWTNATDSDCCVGWHGVACDPPSAGEITSLDLSTLSLGGMVDPDALFSLTNLTTLNLAFNRLNFSEVLSSPRAFEKLHRLKVLNLSDSGFRGQIPMGIATLTDLRSLDMSYNPQLDGSLPEMIRSLVSLESLMLSNCNLSGSIPSSLSSLPSLKAVDLSSNDLSGKVQLNLLMGLQNLSILDLSYNRLTVMGPESSDAAWKNSALPKMIKLKLVSCNITKFPLFLRDLAKLEHLDLSLNRMEGNIPSWLWTIGGGTNSLKYLNLSHNILTGFEEPPFDLANSSLKTIDLHSNRLKGSFPLPPPGNVLVDYSNNYLSSEIPENISQYLEDTHYFLISNNSLSGKILPNFCESRALEFLDVSLNNFSGPIPPCLGQLPFLDAVNLRGNRFVDKIPSNLFNTNCRFIALDLNSNQLSGNVPVSLRNCQMLKVLDLGNNRLDGEFPSWLGNLSSLLVLLLGSNRFHGPVDAPNGSFKHLKIVDLSSNNFNGRLPLKQFSNMKKMMVGEERSTPPWHLSWTFSYNNQISYTTYWTVIINCKGVERSLEKLSSIYTKMDVSSNRFEGSIPDEIGKLNALTFFNTSHNLLSGSIPTSIGNLKKLQSLDFSDNQLSGQIPRELSKLSFLSVLNLSYNNLSGEIPKGKQFNTFQNSSFVGNFGLCGYPSGNNCSNSTASNRETFPSHHENKPDWEFFLFGGLGFGWGFVLSVASLLLCRRWGKLFNHWVDSTLLPFVTSKLWRNCMRLLDGQSERAE